MKFIPAAAAILLAVSAPAWAQPAKPAAKAVSAPKPAAFPPHVALPKTVTPDRYAITIRPSADKLSFSGHEDIALTVRTATDRIVLNAADIAFQKAALSGQSAAPKVELDKEQQTAAFVFAKPLAPGRYTLSLDYTGVIYEQASGLFALDYTGEGGKKQRALFTQFENSDARRFIPSWDEPGVKAVYALTVEAPAGEMAVSNMPVASTAPSSNGLQTVRFADTPKMNSYLLFFALGDFERIHKMVGQTDVGVIVRKGKAAQAQFALDAAAEILPWYNDYFGTPYPLPKLDFIAGPGQSQFFAAMENWGAIYYFDYALLIDPKLSTEQDKQNVYVDIAHEMAHQWFGDLVTMAWWDDLWLNEGFASWMENKTTDHFHPEWKIWLQTKAGEQNAMRTDARAGTHPVITPIHDVFAAANAFDGITYEKGHSVIHMLETYVGEDVFRQGVRNYIAHHAYGNTVTDDLWTEIDKVSPKKITGIAHDFTLQAGVPLISAAKTPDAVTLTQGRFGADEASKAPRSWRTPVVVTGLGQPWRPVVSADSSAFKAAKADATPLINAGQTGYFRSRYSPELETRVVAAFPSLAGEDQLGLIYDSRALGEAGYAPLTDFLLIARKAQDAHETVVLRALIDQLTALDDLYKGLPTQAAFRAFARTRLAPAFARLGWDAKPAEADNDALARRDLLSALSQFDDPAVVAEARKRFAGLVANPDGLRGANRLTVLQIVAAHADAAAWDQLHAMAKASTESTDRSRLYRYLGAAHDPALADKALALSLTKEPPPTDAPNLISSVARVFPEKAFDFAIANRAAVEAMVEPTSRTTYFAVLANGSGNAAILPKLKAFAETVPASTRPAVTRTLSGISYRLDIIARRLPDVDRWLAANPG
ncbi:M1 family metallopeptidase [Phenylobacterium sp.]|uniref:M1 family metallopeptidase n=1 Tax=Phenylobacterium sp. TaxID=1871053 RepID=UPI0011FF0D99|nr:M1 family metallopeptidase [Phenylobacterium sp.]THD59336.1 MAG: M1 family peptidase [Phenylobacterium sp.]